MIPLEGAGKGDTPRSVDRKVFSQRMDEIFGRRDTPKQFKRFIKVYGKQEEKSNDAFYVPNINPSFNHGLGCVTYGTRDAEKKEKRMGKVPIGDARIEQVFSRNDDRQIDNILKDGLVKARAQMRKEE